MNNGRKQHRRIISLLVIMVVWTGSLQICSAHEIAKELHDACIKLWNSLDEDQQKNLLFEFDDELRKDWQFIPMERKGLAFGAMKTNQQLLAMSLVQTALSHRGFQQSMEIMALEEILFEMENNRRVRDPKKYHLFLFGKPSLDSTWGWRVEGHHLSISFTVVDGEQVACTPLFMGTNPAEVKEGPQAGLRVLGMEEDLGRQLVKQLSVKQKEVAIIADKAPRDVINGPGRDAEPLDPKGISATQLNENQRQILRKIVETYANKLRSELAEADLKKIDDAGFDNIHFAWAGEIPKGRPHYYRVQGPTFIMEYDNTQNGANHVHLVWRDFQNDFGEDLLRNHYQSDSHESKDQ